MQLFDIIGPIMIGPSSSHTAGAARIGRVARQLLGEKPVKELSRLYGITENNVYQIKFRTRRLLRKHGPRCFERALRKEGYATLAFVA